MFTAELHYDYPERLVAQEPQKPYRALFCQVGEGSASSSLAREITPTQVLELFQPGDVLVVNNTRVLPRRVTTPAGLEILFLHAKSAHEWEVLFPAREVKDGAEFVVAQSWHSEPVMATLVARGLPQTLRLSHELTEDFFNEHGELALPPYIQKARGERRNRPEDREWYQTAWALVAGSHAAPTASLHFSKRDMNKLRKRGVIIAPLTLHVGIGTFLPIKTARLDEHVMHREWTFIPKTTTDAITAAKTRTKVSSGQRPPKVWALGTTATRAIESWAAGKLSEVNSGDFGSEPGFAGETDLFIKPGFKFEVIDALLTNFHQPGSTLIALVAAFAGSTEKVFAAYKFAIQNDFRLFSYGDLSIWLPEKRALI